MPSNNTWLDKISRAMAEFDAMQSLGNVQSKLDEVEFRKNPGLWMWTKPASLGIEALSQVGRPIAAVGGALGAAESEAGQEAAASGSPEDKLRMLGEGAAQGWSEGDDTFKDRVGALDVASLATGGLAGALAKGGKAMSLASGLQKADLSLSAADMALGGGNVYEGVRDDDMAKVGFGVFRIVGNAVGASRSLDDLAAMSDPGLAETRGFKLNKKGGTVVDRGPLRISARDGEVPGDSSTRQPREADPYIPGGKIKHRSHKGPDGPVDFRGESALDAIDNMDVITPFTKAQDDAAHTSEQLAHAIKKTPSMKVGENVYQDNDGYLYKDTDTGEEYPLKTTLRSRDLDGEEYTVESLIDPVEKIRMERGGKDSAAEVFARTHLAGRPELDALASWLRGLDADGQNDIIGLLSRELDPATASKAPLVPDSTGKMVPQWEGGNNPMELLAGAAKFRGFFNGGPAEGFTFTRKLKMARKVVKDAIESVIYRQPVGKELDVLEPRPGKVGDPSADKAYYLDPKKIADDVEGQWEGLMSGADSDGMFAIQKFLSKMSPEMQSYVKSVWQGGARAPELDLKFKAEVFFRQLMYNALHEAFGHARTDTFHTSVNDGGARYRTDIMNRRGREVGVGLNEVNLVGRAPDKYSAFEPLHNAILKAMEDPFFLQRSKSLAPQQKESIYKLFAGEAPELKERVKFARDRVIGRAEAKDAVKSSGGDLVETGRNYLNPEGLKPGEKLGDLLEAAESKAAAGEPPTPPDQGPPSSAANGPEMQPLAKRIKSALTEHQRAVNQNALKRTEVNKVRAELLKRNEEQFFSQKLSHEEFTAEAKKIMSGAYDLIGKVDPLTISQGEIPEIMQKIAAQSNDDAFVRQRGQIAFDKMMKGQRLEDNEIQLMRQLLGEREDAIMQDPLGVRLMQFFANATGGARALLTSYDVSAAGRQALYGSVMNPREAASAFKAQIDALKMSPAEFDSMMLRLQDPTLNPYAELAKASGLHFSESANKGAAKAEEAFMHGKWAEKIPGVKRTEQAYIAYLNKLRVELFNKHIRVLQQSGTPLFDAEGGVTQTVKDLAYMVNTLTGRGEMALFHMSPNSTLGKKLGLKETLAPGAGAMDKAHEALTTVFFAPRFAASRAALMRDTVQALVGGGLDPAISRIYMKNVIGTISAMTAVAGGLASMGVGTFQSDPKKKDFGVLKVGKTRYDLYGGLKQWAKIVHMIGADEYVSGRSRLPKKYSSGPMTKTKTEELYRFAHGKLSPLSSFIVEAMTGEDFMGRKSILWENAYRHSIPMIAQTMIDLYKEDELEQLPFAVPAAVVGIGVNTYSDRRFKQRDR